MLITQLWPSAANCLVVFLFLDILLRFLGVFLRRVGVGGGIRTSFILRPCPKRWYLQRFCLFVQHTAQGCGTRKSVTSVYLARKDPKHAAPKGNASDSSQPCCPKKKSFRNPLNTSFLLRTAPAGTNAVSCRARTQAKYRALTR